jgi:hypothetical protein
VIGGACSAMGMVRAERPYKEKRRSGNVLRVFRVPL